MIKHFLVTALRQFQKNKLFSLINIFGLAVAMSVCIVIFLFTSNELSFDRFHDNHSDIYRINFHLKSQGSEIHAPITSGAMGPDLYNTIPEIEDFTRLSYIYTVNIFKDENYFTFDNAMVADTNFFSFFSFNLLEGNPETVLLQPRNMVITQRVARQLFPDHISPVGQTLRVNDQDGWLITGLVEDCPPNSHIQFDILTSRETQVADGIEFSRWDAYINLYTYVRLSRDFNMDALIDKTKQVAYEKVNQESMEFGEVNLEYSPMNKIRMYSQMNFEMGETGTGGKVRWFVIIALFVLFIAAFNYVNLTVAKSGSRSKETGVRKVVGAGNHLIRQQFFLETFITTGISFIIALVIAELLLPWYSYLLDAQLSIFSAPLWAYPAALFLFVFFFGFVAGVYPAYFMAGFQPVKILKGQFVKQSKGMTLRRILLALQFLVSVGLIICTLVVFLQLLYFRNQSYGFNHENLMAVSIQGQNIREDAQLFGNRLETYPGIKTLSITSAFPGSSIYREGFELPGYNQNFLLHHIHADRNFLNALDVKLYQGRYLEAEDGLELGSAVINREMARQAAWQDPVGEILVRGEYRYRVVGIVEDFHYESFHEPVGPLVITALDNRPERQPIWLLLRYDENMGGKVLSEVQEIWENLFPGRFFNFLFVNQTMGDYYRVEQNFGRMFILFSSLAIIIAMLGVLGLSVLSSRQRMKEIAVRRVLGASVMGILRKFSMEYLILIAIASLIAVPLAFYLMENWLASFAYSISFPWWTALTAVIIITATSIAIASAQLLRVSKQNPAEVLNYE